MTTKVAASALPTPWGVFAIHAFDDEVTGKEHVALTMGNVTDGAPVLLRVHSECLTGDALFSQRCDCGSQLEYAMKKIAAEQRGAILYLRQEGRGIGLVNKIKAYELQDRGADTVEANEQLGFGADMRDYQLCGDMLRQLHIGSVKLMTNNPRKVEALRQLGINIVERLPIETGRNPHNAKYLSTKVDKLGHLIKPVTE